ncbi:hypothetical protein FOZ76_21050 [Verticiella sediminum]|uniref:Cell division protein ZipA n=1 Tax=Verticiella sediminum TaxID=1247510 RepID=A0A556ABS3_9BURK|nr:cell division protein ZipA C-terminal FtsZ-binding domain-containing protein [Verticiella sediminum]TSH90317.1 hypothetical protein FOZ76_21050 [Verticiella sediminum]
MSDLQMGLVALGILLIAVVLGLNWWQDRRVSRKMQETFSAAGEDPLLGDAAPADKPVKSRKTPAGKAEPRLEPGMGAAAAESPMRREPAVRVVETDEQGDDDDEPDAGCEAVIDLIFGHPVAARDLLPLVRELHKVGQKPLRAFFRTVDGQHCANLRLDRDYVAMQIAVLLANRSGALAAAEWAQAWARAERIADQLDAQIEGPDPQDVLEMAQQLDGLCASLDTSVGLTLVPQGPQPWRVAEVLSVARDAGFVESREPDHLEFRDEDGAVRFTLSHPAPANGASGTLSRLTLLLDVPRSPASDTAFADMARTARQLAEVLDANVVDDNGLPLAEGGEGAVDAHLRRLYGELAANGLRAGSPRSLRVFA